MVTRVGDSLGVAMKATGTGQGQGQAGTSHWPARVGIGKAKCSCAPAQLRQGPQVGKQSPGQERPQRRLLTALPTT